MTIVAPQALLLLPPGFVPVLGPKHGGFDIGVLGVILLFLFYCGQPPTKPCYILSSFTGKVLGSTASYRHITDTRPITIKCFIGGWERLPPCPISCGHPPVTPEFRLLNFTSGTLEGDIRYYRCNAPKEMMTQISTSSSCPIVTCQGNKLWTDFNIECRFSQSLGTVISSSGASGIVTSPNYPANYMDTANPTYGYSIVTAGKSLDFMFHGAFGLNSKTELAIRCGLNGDDSSERKTFSNTVVLPSPFTCPTGCANVLFGAFGGVGSNAGFNLTWQANL